MATTRTFDRTDPDARPPWSEAVPLGLQHVLAMFTSNLTPAILLAGVIGATTGEAVLLVQAALLCAGSAGRRSEGQPSSAARYSPTTDGSRMTGPITATPAAPAASSAGTSSGLTPPSAYAGGPSGRSAANPSTPRDGP